MGWSPNLFEFEFLCADKLKLQYMHISSLHAGRTDSDSTRLCREARLGTGPTEKICNGIDT